MKTYQRLLLTEKQQASILADLDGIRYKLSLAQERLNRMFYATYDGELHARIPVPAGGLLLRLWRWLRRPDHD